MALQALPAAAASGSRSATTTHCTLPAALVSGAHDSRSGYGSKKNKKRQKPPARKTPAVILEAPSPSLHADPSYTPTGLSRSDGAAWIEQEVAVQMGVGLMFRSTAPSSEIWPEATPSWSPRAQPLTRPLSVARIASNSSSFSLARS